MNNNVVDSCNKCRHWIPYDRDVDIFDNGNCKKYNIETNGLNLCIEPTDPVKKNKTKPTIVKVASEITCPTCGEKKFSLDKKDVWYVEENKVVTSVKKKICTSCGIIILYNFTTLSFTVEGDIGFDRFLKRIVNDPREEVIFDYDFKGIVNFNRRKRYK